MNSNSNAKDSGFTLESFKRCCKELSKRIYTEKWDNNFMLFHVKKITGKGLEGYVINGGFESTFLRHTLDIKTVPKEYYEEVSETGLLIIRENEYYLIDNHSLTDICKAAGLGGDSMKIPALERDVFLEYCLIERFNDKHKAIISFDGKVKKLLALRKPRFAMCDTGKLARLAEELMNDGYTFVEWLNGSKFKTGLLTFLVKRDNIVIKISDSQTGDASLTVEGGYLTPSGNFITIHSEHFYHRSEIDMDEVHEKVFEAEKRTISFLSEITKKENRTCDDIYPIWLDSELRLADRKSSFTPSKNRAKELLEEVSSLKEGVNALNILFDEIDDEFASRREISESMGSILKAVLKGAK